MADLFPVSPDGAGSGDGSGTASSGDILLCPICGKIIRTATPESGARVEGETSARVEGETGARVERETGARVEGDTSARVERETGARVEGDTSARVEGETGARVEGETGARVEGETGAHVEGDTSVRVEGETGARVEGETGAHVEGDTSAPMEGETGARVEGDYCRCEEVFEAFGIDLLRITQPEIAAAISTTTIPTFHVVPRGLRMGAGTSGGNRTQNAGLPENLILDSLVPEDYNHPPPGVVDDECSICMEKYETGDVLGRINCTHKFHFNCIKRWLVEKNDCPNCKKTAIEPEPPQPPK